MPVFPERLVVLRTGQWRQAEELEKIDGQLFLDNLDIAPDRLRRVRRKAQYVSCNGQDTLFLPSELHVAILGDLVPGAFSPLQDCPD